MKCIIIILSHKLSDVQLKELTDMNLEPVYLPKELQDKASNIDPESDAATVHQNVTIPIRDYIKSNNINYGVIGGELTFVSGLMVSTSPHQREGYNQSWYQCNWYTATTKRISKDVVNADGSITKTSVFVHVKFRALFN